jgi:hypothetical protein
MGKLRKLFTGGSSANEQLTAVVAMLLLPLLAVEGVTLLNLRSLLGVHAFVGILLIPGVWLLAVDRTEGTLVGLHKASFVVWVGAFGLHVLSRLVPALRALRRRVPGLSLRLGIATLSLVAGLTVAMATLPAVDHLQDNVSGHVGFDSE